MPVTFAQLGQLGRRGNMFFQAASVISLAFRNGDDYIFPHCELEGTTNIPLDKFSDNINYSATYQEPYFHYHPIPYQPNLNIHNSFLQSYKYFADYDFLIKHLFSYEINNSESYKDYTSIHVRRGDYLTHYNCYIILDRNNYYDKAMQLIGSSKFLIFSDDFKWCKNHFKGNEFDFVEGNPAHIDISIMAKCANNIIGNSSMSWWASYLNNNSNKKVIAPKNWFGPALSHHNTKDLYMPDWIKI